MPGKETISYVPVNNPITFEVRRERYIPPPIEAKTVEGHEALHIGAADGDAEFATAKAGNGYAGLTRLRRQNLVALVGPDSWNSIGTGDDMRKARNSGHSEEALKSVARSKIAKNHGPIVEITNELKNKGTIYKGDIDRAWKRARMKEKNGEFASITQKNSAGQVEGVSRVRVNEDGSIPIVVFDAEKHYQSEYDLVG